MTRHLMWSESGPRIANRDLSDAEASLRCSLPNDYRRFVLRHNGGVPSLVIFPIDRMPKNPTGEVRCLRSIGHPDDVLDLVASNGRLAHALPPLCVSVGDDASGDQILLFVDGPRTGQVWFYDWYSKYRNPERRIYFIAKTFDAFLESLRDLTAEEQAEIDALVVAAESAPPEESDNPKKERPTKRRGSKPVSSTREKGRKPRRHP